MPEQRKRMRNWNVPEIGSSRKKKEEKKYKRKKIKKKKIRHKGKLGSHRHSLDYRSWFSHRDSVDRLNRLIIIVRTEISPRDPSKKEEKKYKREIENGKNSPRREHWLSLFIFTIVDRLNRTVTNRKSSRPWVSFQLKLKWSKKIKKKEYKRGKKNTKQIREKILKKGNFCLTFFEFSRFRDRRSIRQAGSFVRRVVSKFTAASVVWRLLKAIERYRRFILRSAVRATLLKALVREALSLSSSISRTFWNAEAVGWVSRTFDTIDAIKNRIFWWESCGWKIDWPVTRQMTAGDSI